jgi:hypothetical protein
MQALRNAGVTAICLCCGVLTWSQTAQWKEFVYQDDGFAISAPSQPIMQKRMMKPLAGEVEAHVYFIPAPEYQMMVMYAPLHPKDKRTPQQALEDAKKGPAVSGARLLSQKSIMLGKYPGLEMETEDDDNHQLGRFYAVNRRMYTLAIAVPKGRPFPAEAKHWLESFRIVAPEK